MTQNAYRRVVAGGAVIATAMFMVEAVAGKADADQAEYVIEYLGVGGKGSDVAHVPGFMNPDGTGERYPNFGHPDQLSWIFGPAFSDGRRIVITSYQDVDLTRVRAGKVVTHDWIYDLVTGEVTEILQKNRPAQHTRAKALLQGDTRIIATAIINGEERVFAMDLDGSNQVQLSEANSGFHYGLSLSADEKRLAFHVTGGTPAFHNPGPYSINVIDLATKQRVLIAGQPGHLYFGPKWSPDDSWLVYMDCVDKEHFRAALCLGRPDGSIHRAVTPGQTHWFGTPYGSNMPEWSPDGKTVTYTRLLDNSKHDMSEGGTQICLLNPFTDQVTELTAAQEGKWDFRPAWSPDSSKLLFTRVHGGYRELWIMDPDGSNQRRMTQGYQKKGADFPRWFRIRTRQE